MKLPPREELPLVGVLEESPWFFPQTTMTLELPSSALLFEEGQAASIVADDVATIASSTSITMRSVWRAPVLEAVAKAELVPASKMKSWSAITFHENPVESLEPAVVV